MLFRSRDAQNAIGMLKTPVAQQALYLAFPDASRLHSTPYNSRTRSRHDESQPAGSKSARHRELVRNQLHVMTRSEAQRIVDEARNKRGAGMAGARGAPPAGASVNQPEPSHAGPTVTSPRSSPCLTGLECLSEAIRSEPFPSDFKEPRKVVRSEERRVGKECLL